MSRGHDALVEQWRAAYDLCEQGRGDELLEVLKSTPIPRRVEAGPLFVNGRLTWEDFDRRSYVVGPFGLGLGARLRVAIGELHEQGLDPSSLFGDRRSLRTATQTSAGNPIARRVIVGVVANFPTGWRALTPEAFEQTLFAGPDAVNEFRRWMLGLDEREDVGRPPAVAQSGVWEAPTREAGAGRDAVDLPAVAEALGGALAQVPRDAPGPAFGPQADGRLAMLGWVDPLRPRDAEGVEGLLSDLCANAQALVAALVGTNSHSDLLEAAEGYLGALGPAPSIYLLVARGIAVESTADVVRNEVSRDERAPLPVEAQRRLGILIDLHATYVMSTPLGRNLVEGAAAYRLPHERQEALRLATGELATAVAQTPRLVAETAAAAVREAAETLGTGPRPERSTWASLLTVRGFLIGVSGLLATAGTEVLLSLITGTVTASAPVAAAVQSGGGVITAAWDLMVASAPQLQVIALALGAEAAWLSSLAGILDWVRRRSRLR